VSEIPFNLICSGRSMYPVQNTLVTLSISLLALKGIRAVQTWEPEEGAFGGRAGAVWLKTAAIVLTAAASMAAAGLLNSDYGPLGVLFILTLYFYNGNFQAQSLAGGAVLILLEGIVWGGFGCIAFFFISRYNGTRGRRLGYLPYVFYPAHLLIIYFIGVRIYGIHF
ncbi:MAG: TraX family protein, partial [Alitiscatomonas sp.]